MIEVEAEMTPLNVARISGSAVRTWARLAPPIPGPTPSPDQRAGVAVEGQERGHAPPHRLGHRDARVSIRAGFPICRCHNGIELVLIAVRADCEHRRGQQREHDRRVDQAAEEAR